MTSNDLLNWRPPDPPAFGGESFDAERDGARLSAQALRVQRLMADEVWRSLDAISQATGDPQASVSARLRDLRKPWFGGFRVERRHVHRGLHEYRVLAREASHG